MPTSDPLRILLAHDLWATWQIISACAPLADDDLHRRFEMGPGSLHDTLTHMVAAMHGWNDALANREMRPRLEGTRRSLAEISELLTEAAAELDDQSRRLRLDELVTRTREGVTRTFTRGAVLTHITTHGMHHRAQCLNMLRRIGVSPLPRSSVVEWTTVGETGSSRLI